MISGRRGLATGVLLVVGLTACGKKGPPLPPLRPVPARVTDLKARVADGRVELSFTVPAANADGSQPPAIERVEVYRVAVVDPPPTPTPTAPTPPAAARGPAQIPAGSIVQPANLRGTLTVRPPDTTTKPAPAPANPAPPPTPPTPPRPAAGEVATFVDDVSADPSDRSWRYVVLGVAGRDRRGPTSAPVVVPLGAIPATPGNVRLDFDETRLRLSWTGGTAGDTFAVFESGANASTGARLTPDPLAGTEFTRPVVFGTRVCLTVRAIVTRGAVTTESASSAAACETPVDRFPPPVPTGFLAQADQGAVTLVWSASTAPDLAGYLILRGVGPGDTLQPLSNEPVLTTSFRDTTVQSGVTYTYAVVSVDRSSNRSAASNRQQVTVRETGKAK